MRKTRFNRIFWKLFAAIWLTNIVIIVLAFVVIAHGSARSKFVANYNEQVIRLSESIVDAYEHNKALPFGGSAELRRLKRRLHVGPELMVDVLNAAGQPIYQSHRKLTLPDRLAKNTPKIKPKARLFQPSVIQELTVTGDSGLAYRVVYASHSPPEFIRDAIASVLSIQLMLMFVTSALISALISWRIVKPLKLLEGFGKIYSGQIQEQRPQNSLASMDVDLRMRGDEIGDLARAIANMVMQVDKAFNAQKSLMHDVSHELRAPLARLQVAASLIEQRDSSSKFVQRVHSECRRLNDLIDGILTFSHIQSTEEQFQKTNLGELVNAVVRDVHFEFPRRVITCNFPLLETKMWVDGSSKILKRAFENIIRNACKHTPETGTIEISIEDVIEGWVVSCRDHGLGVSDDEIERLIQPFYRAGNEMHTEGFGLGLSIAQKAIVLHGGRLTIANHPEGGLVVSVLLPKQLVH